MKVISASANQCRSGLKQILGFALTRVLFTMSALAFLLALQSTQARAQGYVIGTSAITANPQVVDTYSATELDPYASYYYDAYVEGYLYKKPSTSLIWDLIRNGSAYDDPLAYGYMNAPTETRNSYQIESDHYVVAYFYYPTYGFYNPYGWGFASQEDPWWPSGYQFLPGSPGYVTASYLYLGTTGVGVSTYPPAVEGIQPASAARGTNGYIALYGSDMLGTTQAQLSGTGTSLTPVYVGANQVNVQFNIDSTAATGARDLTLTNTFGTGNPDEFTITDPTPEIAGISPASWEVGAQTEVVISGKGFGTNPLVNITGSGVTITLISVTDAEIRASFTIDPNAVEGSRTVTVTSRGYGGNPFIPDPATNSTPNSNGTTFSVATPVVTFSQFNSVVEGVSRSFDVRLDSVVPSRNVQIRLSTAQGQQGEARFGDDQTTLTVGVGITSIAIKGIARSSSVDNISLVAEFGPKKFEEKFTVTKLNLREATFSGSGMRTLRKDDNSGDFTGPHWQDNSAVPDQDADDTGDRKYPVAYVRNNPVTASIKLVPYPNVSLDGVVLYVRGDGPGSLDFPYQTVTTSAGSSGDNGIVISDFVTTGNLSTTVDFFDPLEIKWEFSNSRFSGTPWQDTGKSKNQAYVTLNIPMTRSPLLHTIVHLACESTKGKTDNNQILDAIWSIFTTPTSEMTKLKRIDGTKLKYYNPYLTLNTKAEDLVKDGNGQCGSFATLLLDLLYVHGLTHITFDPSSSFNYVFVYPSAEPSPTGGSARYGFLVRDWSYTTGPGKSFDPEYPYLNLLRSTLSQGYDWWYKQVTDLDGLPAQGSPNPRSRFNNHQFVQINGKWYDPSYGVIYIGATENDRIKSFQSYLSGLDLFQTSYTVTEMHLGSDLNGNGDLTDTYSGNAFLIKKMPSSETISISKIPFVY